MNIQAAKNWNAKAPFENYHFEMAGNASLLLTIEQSQILVISLKYAKWTNELLK